MLVKLGILSETSTDYCWHSYNLFGRVFCELCVRTRNLVFPPRRSEDESSEMAPKQRMRYANEKASKFVTMRGNVPKSTVSSNFYFLFILRVLELIFL